MIERIPPFFVYDGACGFCERWVRWLSRRTEGRVTFVPYQDIDDLGGHGLAIADVQRASFWVDGEGRTFGGNRSIGKVLQESTGIWKLVGTVIELPVVRTLAAVAYFGISRNRHRLPAPG